MQRSATRVTLSVATAFSVPALVGCHASSRPRDTYGPSETKTHEPVKGRPELGVPAVLPAREVCVVPLVMEDVKGWFSDGDPFTKGGAYDSGVPAAMKESPDRHGYGAGVRWHNALFRDLRSGGEWALLGRRGVISQWQVLGPRNEQGELVESRALVFIVIERDTSGDGVLNDFDERVAVVTDGAGRGARRVTPDGAQVWTVAYEPAANAAFFLVTADTNNDGKIDHADESVPYVLNLLEDKPAAAAEPVVSADLVRKATSLLTSGGAGAEPARDGRARLTPSARSRPAS